MRKYVDESLYIYFVIIGKINARFQAVTQVVRMDTFCCNSLGLGLSLIFVFFQDIMIMTQEIRILFTDSNTTT